MKRGKSKNSIKTKEKLSLFQRLRETGQRHRGLFFFIISILVILFLVFGTKFYLLFNFLLGHDTLISLETNEEDFFLKNLETAKVNFDMYVSTNIFCEADCEYLFQDLSTGYILDKGNFTTRISNPNSLEYSLVAPERGEGQKLFHFEVECRSKETNLCKTSETSKKRSYLIALNYELSDEQKEFREEANEKLKKVIFEYDELKRIKLENQEIKKLLSEHIIVDSLERDKLSEISEDIDFLLSEWKNYEYEGVLENILSEKMNETRKILIETNENLTLKFEEYNSFVSEIDELRKEIIKLTLIENISEENYEKISSIIKDYNNVVKDFNQSFDLNLYKEKAQLIGININQTKLNINQNFSVVYNYSQVNSSNLIYINKPFYSNYSSGKSIESEVSMCCYKGDCDVCCTVDCSNDPEKYPVILVHGHSFNDAISAESSLGDLQVIKEALIDDGYIDGGYVIIKKLNSTGTFARTNHPIVFATSYYFDIYQTESEIESLQTKAESLDTYALRLNDIVENVKLMTNRSKVNIVAHSMGGLVSRRYMQIFGSDSVENLVMIGTPNHGVDGYVLSSCPVLGADIHCEMMDKNSLFINKLNYGEIPKTNVSVIIGIGCETEGEVSDGVVKNSSAFLPWARNYYVNGSCSGINFFHVEMKDVKKYPEIYELVKKELGIE